LRLAIGADALGDGDVAGGFDEGCELPMGHLGRVDIEIGDLTRPTDALLGASAVRRRDSAGPRAP
jgi:hypothetical protein